MEDFLPNTLENHIEENNVSSSRTNEPPQILSIFSEIWNSIMHILKTKEDWVLFDDYFADMKVTAKDSIAYAIR